MDQAFSNEENDIVSNNSSNVEFYSLKGDMPEEEKDYYNFADHAQRNQDQ